MVFSSIVKGKADLNDEILSENFYHTVNLFIQLLGAEQVSKTDMFFRISRAAIGSYVDYSEIQRILARITSFDRWYEAWKTSADHFSEIAEAVKMNFRNENLKARYKGVSGTIKMQSGEVARGSPEKIMLRDRNYFVFGDKENA